MIESPAQPEQEERSNVFSLDEAREEKNALAREKMLENANAETLFMMLQEGKMEPREIKKSRRITQGERVLLGGIVVFMNVLKITQEKLDEAQEEIKHLKKEHE